MVNKINTLEELRKEFNPPADVNVIHRRKLSKMDKLALIITTKIGTMGFFFILAIWVGAWIVWNTVLPKSTRFDPFPAFVLLLFLTNIIEILLMPLIMVGQNIQGKHADLRSEYDYETDKKAEKEIETILLHLERQEELIIQILKRIEKLEGSKS